MISRVGDGQKNGIQYLAHESSVLVICRGKMAAGWMLSRPRLLHS